MHRPIFGEMTQVRFVVITPDSPADQPDEIYCSMSIDGWPEQGRALPKIAPHVYAAAGPLRSGSWVEYKFLREKNWDSVEKGENLSEIDNRRLTIKSDVVEQVVLHRVASWADRPRLTNTSVEFNRPGDGAPLVRESTLSGDIRTHHLFHSPELQNARTVMVYLPPGYDESPNERYPVLYMHDGNNVFDAKTAATGVEWGVDETAERLIALGKMQKTIIVAIFNTTRRTKEYSPFKDELYGGGFGDAYLEFIASTLKPYIDKTYRTLPDREQTGLAGSSLGGLISLYGVFSRPETFGLAAAISPALWWAQRKIFDYLKTVKAPQPLKLWIDMGTDEGEAAGPLVEYKHGPDDCTRLVKVLESHKYRKDQDFHYEKVVDGRHHELDWAARVDQVLQYLFGVEETAELVGASDGSRKKAK